jgi:hypothetical protein
MRNGRDLQNLERLKVDFMYKFPKTDYFTQQEFFKYINMAYCIGRDDTMKTREKCIVRSDGKKYKSMLLAARDNGIHDRTLYRAIKLNKKTAGYFWKYA